MTVREMIEALKKENMDDEVVIQIYKKGINRMRIVTFDAITHSFGLPTIEVEEAIFLLPKVAPKIIMNEYIDVYEKYETLMRVENERMEKEGKKSDCMHEYMGK